jgi:hypothetical protein
MTISWLLFGSRLSLGRLFLYLGSVDNLLHPIALFFTSESGSSFLLFFLLSPLGKRRRHVMPECFLPFSHRTYLNPPKAPGIPKLGEEMEAEVLVGGGVGRVGKKGNEW